MDIAPPNQQPDEHVGQSRRSPQVAAARYSPPSRRSRRALRPLIRRRPPFVEIIDQTSGAANGVPYRVFAAIGGDGASSAATMIGYEGLIADSAYVATADPDLLPAIINWLDVDCGHLRASSDVGSSTNA